MCRAVSPSSGRGRGARLRLAIGIQIADLHTAPAPPAPTATAAAATAAAAPAATRLRVFHISEGTTVATAEEYTRNTASACYVVVSLPINQSINRDSSFHIHRSALHCRYIHFTPHRAIVLRLRAGKKTAISNPPQRANLSTAIYTYLTLPYLTHRSMRVI